MGKRSNFERNPRDYYPTPLSAVLPLMPHLEYGCSFIEPCAGNFALAGHLESYGMSCVQAFDIHPMDGNVYNVYEDDALGDWTESDSADYIITNPPWDVKILHPMIERFSALRPTWLLFGADWMHTQQSRQFLHLLDKVVSVGRVKWIPDSKSTGMDNAAWYLFDANHSGPTEFVGRV